eukprot:796153-Pyramimonas_sp.AAC.1
MATGLARNAGTVEHHLDEYVLWKARRADFTMIKRIRRLRYLERVVNHAPATLRRLVDILGTEGTWLGMLEMDFEWLQLWRKT